MFTRSDLSDLSAAEAPFSVSLFLPTHVKGAEVRQGPIRLKNLIGEAAETLTGAGMRSVEAEALLAPAAALMEDYDFWQHQEHGLALFLDRDGMRSYRVPLALNEQVVTGPRFHLKPLLPLLEADGTFRVLTLTADKVLVYSGSRFSMSPDETVDLPDSLADVAGESDYENPVQASPVARPNTGSLNIGNAQVYGDSPPEWRKRRLVEFAEHVAAALDAATARQPLPVVLVADATLAGHVAQASSLGPLLAGVVDTNPEALDVAQLHEAAYAVMRPRLDAARGAAVERFAAWRGQNDQRAVADDAAVVQAATQGRIDTLLLRPDPTLWGHYDPDTGTVTPAAPGDSTSEDLYEKAALLTVEYGGTVHVLAEQDLPDLRYGAAVLRF
jgi:hypothetical protein